MNKKIKYLGVMFVSTLLAALGQLFFKYAFNTPGQFIPWFIVSILAYGFSTVIYLIVLSRVHLSWAYGIGGLSYIFATILAATVLLEPIPLLRWVGVLAIFIGVVIIGMT
jgi:drug/metabolite transporter (DMT)-like permease